MGCSSIHPCKRGSLATPREERRAGIERPRLGVAVGGGGRVAEACLDARGGEPGPPVLTVAPNRGLDRSARGDEVAGALLDERELEVRRRCPGLEPRRGDRVCAGGPEPAGSGSGLALADLDAGEERNRLS